jgi:hypothetical protein
MTMRLAACLVLYGKISRTAFWIFATLLAPNGELSPNFGDDRAGQAAAVMG